MLLLDLNLGNGRPEFPSAKFPDALVSLAKGTPSTMNKGCVLPEIEFKPRYDIEYQIQKYH
jgi:hypothetical protein